MCLFSWQCKVQTVSYSINQRVIQLVCNHSIKLHVVIQRVKQSVSQSNRYSVSFLINHAAIWTVNQPIKQSASQLIKTFSVKQSNMSQSVNKTLSWSVGNQTISQSINQLVSQSICQSVCQSVSQSVSQSVCLSVRQSVSQSVCLPVSQTVSQSVSWSISQSAS